MLSSAGFAVKLVSVRSPGPLRSMRGVQLDIPSVLGHPEGVIARDRVLAAVVRLLDLLTRN